MKYVVVDANTINEDKAGFDSIDAAKEYASKIAQTGQIMYLCEVYSSFETEVIEKVLSK